MASKKGETIKAALVLFGITLVAGVCLAAVYAVTEEPIQKQKDKKQQAAYQEVLSNADHFETPAEYATYVEDSADVIAANGLDLRGAYITSAVCGVDASGETVGYVVNAVSPKGYGGNIELSIGFDSEGVVTGVAILSINETAGLGMNAKNESFRAQYIGQVTDSYFVTKTNATEPGAIDAISSATVTSKAVTDAVNAAKIFVNESLLGREEADL